jgi:predicted metal-dependent enzyme (double-stranded beta helix superfamily)
MMQNAWGDFIEAAEPVIRQVQEPGNTVLAIEPLLRRLVARPDWLKEKYRRAIPDTIRLLNPTDVWGLGITA